VIIRGYPSCLSSTACRPDEFARRAALLSRWQCENVVVSASLRDSAFEPFSHGLSVKAAWSGREHYFLGSRRLSVDDDSYLILNEGARYRSAVDAAAPVDSLGIFFRPGLADEALGALRLPLARILDCGAGAPLRAPYFAEHLRAHDNVVSPLLREIRRQVEAGEDDEAWYEEQLQRLIGRMIEAEHRLRDGAASITLVQSSTRDELHRRVRIAADFIQSSYTRPITLDDMAAAAHLSKYYLVRLFQQVYGITPHAYLRRKRLAVARRLIERTDLGLAEVADRVGFGSRSAMFRQLRQRFGIAGRAIRHRGASAWMLSSEWV
jgi:AraC-like DNA-binding protein